MKNALILGAAMLLAACSNDSETTDMDSSSVVDITETTVMPEVERYTQDVDMQMAAKTKAVLVYADWCSSCKILEPKIKAVQAMGDMPGVEFVTLDYSDKDADNFYAQAEANGVETAVRAALDGTIKTGMLLLVDIDDERVVSVVTQSDEPDQIAAKIEAALAAS